jgi:hypothetical protein
MIKCAYSLMSSPIFSYDNEGKRHLIGASGASFLTRMDDLIKESDNSFPNRLRDGA